MALAVVLPLAVAVIWGTFAVAGDPSRSGSAPVAVPGVVRLGLELGVFTFAVSALYDLGAEVLSAAMAIAVVVHYVASHDRVRWPLKHR